jgi:TolB-like protein
MIVRRLWQGGCLAALISLAPVLGHAQQGVSSVEGGLQVLAQQIASKIPGPDAIRIAVLPFPNADDTCSVLSTYLADELVQSLSAVAGAPFVIIERMQLVAVINEMQIGAMGILNPETTQSIGRISGVKALIIGTITSIGDRVRVNARLVSTDTGGLMSAAAISIPRTSDVDSLLRQPIPGEGGTCGVHIVSRPKVSPSQAPEGPAETPVASRPAGLSELASLVGIGLSPLTPDLRSRYRIAPGQNGPVVTEVVAGSKAAQRGLHVGDEILEVQGKAVTTPADLQGYVTAARQQGRTTLLLLVQNGDGMRWVPLPTQAAPR